MRNRRLVSIDRSSPAQAHREMREEMGFHLDARVAQLMAQGHTEAEARAEALRRFGADFAAAESRLLASAETRARRMAMMEWLRDFADDVRYALRGLSRQRGFTAVAVLTIAFGIGANTAIYSAVDALLMRALPFREPGRLMDIVQSSPEEGTAAWSWPKYAFYRDNQRSFTTLALHGESPAILTGPDPERIVIEEVSAGYLST